MKYCIGPGVIGPWPYLDISGDDFERIKAAKAGVFVTLGIEEKFMMVLENYLEYERELLNLALGEMILSGWQPWDEQIPLMNRRLGNLLTVARMYIDHIKHDLSRLYGKAAQITVAVTEEFRLQYDDLLGYRVMEAMRNLLQHGFLPISGFRCPNEWEDRDGKDRQARHVRYIVQVEIESLRENGFKSSVLQELEQKHAESQDIAPFIREYIEGLSRVHQTMRAATADDIKVWSSTISAIMQRYQQISSDPIRHVAVSALDDEDNQIEEIYLSAGWIKRLDGSRRRSVPTHIRRGYVSNEIRS